MLNLHKMSIGQPKKWGVVLLRIFVNYLAFLTLFSLQPLSIPPAQAAKPTPPRVGDCYSMPLAEILKPTSTRKKVACSTSHTVETYRVAQWTGLANPATMNEVDRRPIVDEICLPWSQESKEFTKWSYKVPTSSQWRSGLRSIRCDAYSINKVNSKTAQTFVGKKLDFN